MAEGGPKVWFPREADDETRVAATPDAVKRLIKKGFVVEIERGAGLRASVSDEAYTRVGATIRGASADAYAGADVIAKLNPPRARADLDGKHEAELSREGALFVSFLCPLANLDVVRKLRDRRVSAFAMDRIPRITRAQSMDALSSQSNLAGYKAVLLGANALGKIFPMMTTAAGTIRPARVVIMGAGVAGLQALATAKRLGAVVEVSDIRPAVKEQVESLGGRFIDLPPLEGAEDAGGYAREVTPEFLKKQQEIVAARVAEADVVITTALVPGKAAPKLVTAAMVRSMRPGSVIVDLAVEQGGNCALAEPGQVVVKHGVKIVGHLNMPSRTAVDSSALYARNLVNFLTPLVDKETKALKIDWDDEIVKGTALTRDGKIVHPAFAGEGA